MKRFKILSLSTILMMLAFGCYNNDNAITTSVNDVSSRISGLSSDIVGAGAPLTISGSQLDGAVRIAFGNLVVPAASFIEHTATSITFTVPSTAPISASTDILVVFSGSDRAYSHIQVVPIPQVTGINPPAGNAGNALSIYGNNFDNVSAVTIGTTSATITSKTPTQIVVTVPSGVATGKVAVSGVSGSSTSTQQYVVCSGAPTDPLCVTPLNLNSGFELGTGDNFDNWNKYNGGTLLKATTTVPGEVFSGARALKVIVDGTQGGTQQYRIQLVSDLINTTIGTTYTMSIWAKAAAAGGKIRFSTMPTAQYQGDTAVPVTWTLITWTFVAKDVQTRISMDLAGPFNTTYFIDEVKLY